MAKLGRTLKTNRSKANGEGTPLSRHLFSPKIAKRLNPKRPDNTAAIILHNLMGWQKNKYTQTNLGGKRHAFRSLTDLEGDHPYFDRSQIHKALQRINKAEPKQFEIHQRDGKSWFWIGGALNKLDREDKRIGFEPKMAIQHGVNEALLLANLEYQRLNNHKGKTDVQGNWYGSLVPSSLLDKLPMSKDTIERALKKLTKAKVIIKHSDHTNHYAFAHSFVPPKTASKTPQKLAADFHSEAAEFHTKAADFHSQDATRSVDTSHSQANDAIKITYSNECGKECSKVNYISPFAASQARRDVQVKNPPASEGLKFLDSLTESCLAKLRSSSRKAKPQAKVTPAHLPYDVIEDANRDDPHDIDKRSPKKILDDRVQDVIESWEMAGLTYTPAYKALLRRFLHDNPQLKKGWCEEIKIGPRADGITIGKPLEKGDFDPLLFAHKVQTAEAFFKYLPQLIVQSFCENEFDKEDGSFSWEGEIPWQFAAIDYAYKGRAFNSKMIKQEQVGQVESDVESNPFPA